MIRMSFDYGIIPTNAVSCQICRGEGVDDQIWYGGRCYCLMTERGLHDKVRHAPQRVKPANMQDSESSLSVHGVLADFVDEHVKMRGAEKSQVELGTSRLEGKGSAIFIADSVCPINAEVETMFREIFHIHSVSFAQQSACDAL